MVSDLDCIQGWKTASLFIAHLVPPLCLAKCRFVLRPLGFLVSGYTPGTPYKVSCSPTSGAVPPYSSSPNPYQTAVYPVRSAYPQQSPYAQQGTYYTQPLYAAPPHVIHHTTVVQPNGMPATVYPAPIPPPRGNGVTMGMVAGTTMAMSAGTLLTAHSPTPVAPHAVTVPTYRAPGTPTYSYVPPQW